MSMYRIMQFLAKNEGLMFRNDQICMSLGIHPGTLTNHVYKLRRHSTYARYFKSVIKKEGKKRTVYHYVVGFRKFP